ncbi:RNHCP domain-containing protein [Bailinhaonella thermotolerans]|uniref:RNHCP domain-containing protein n=1 Tax=Bailinhaonella thermotolerans TaxID=1070861 RepID=UPI001F5BFA18|nr:RNHCP domain-containing protein [Bailinhaonella thermotolerans]
MSTTFPRVTETFDCVRCGLTVTTFGPDGERRHHCPACLHSRHVLDQAEGGPSECRAAMTPISIAAPRDGGWRVIHRCTRCGQLASAPVHADDNRLILVRMAVRPLAQPPFPLETLGNL